MEPPLSAVGHVEREHRRDGLPEPPARSELPDAEPEVIDQWPTAAVSEPRAGLHAVSVRVEEEPAVVVRVVLRAEARLTVARVTRVDACLPERVDLLAGARGETNMKMARHGMPVVGLCDAELVPLQVLAALRLSPEHRAVEAEAPLEVGHADRHVVEHQRISIASPRE